MPSIEMVNDDLPALSRTDESHVQRTGGSGDIVMNSTPLVMSHTPVSSVQKGGGGEIIMASTPLELDRTPRSLYNQKLPIDRGE